MKTPNSIKVALSLFLLCQSSLAEPQWPPSTFTCYYGKITDKAVDEMKNLDLLVVHPGDERDNLSREKIQRMRATGKDKTIVCLLYTSPSPRD